jgi:hypothetical protein
MDHTTAQWAHDVSTVTTNAQLAGCSTRSHWHPNDDADVGSPFSISPRARHPGQSQISMRDLTPDGSESSCPSNETDSSPIDEEVGLEADSLESPGPEDLNEPWPYTFRVNAIHPFQGMDADSCFRWEIMYGYERREGTGIRAKCRAIMSNKGRLDRY